MVEGFKTSIEMDGKALDVSNTTFGDIGVKTSIEMDMKEGLEGDQKV